MGCWTLLPVALGWLTLCLLFMVNPLQSSFQERVRAWMRFALNLVLRSLNFPTTSPSRLSAQHLSFAQKSEVRAGTQNTSGFLGRQSGMVFPVSQFCYVVRAMTAASVGVQPRTRFPSFCTGGLTLRRLTRGSRLAGGFQQAVKFVFVLTSDFSVAFGSHGLCLPE